MIKVSKKIFFRVHKVLGMDRVLVLDGGRVREFGAPAQLTRARSSLLRLMLKESNVDPEAVETNGAERS